MIIVSSDVDFDNELKFRHLGSSDVTEKYVSWLNDPEVNRFLESRFYAQTLESVWDFVRKCNDSNDTILFGIFKKLSDTVNHSHIGNVKIGPIQPVHRTAEIGILIGDKNAWGKGYGEKTIRAVCEISKKELGIRKLTAGCYGENIGSYKAFSRAGFDCVGERKNHFVSGSGFDSLFLFDKEL